MRKLILVLAISACTSKPNAGIVNNELKTCPDKPNCVSTYADPVDAEHYIKPLATEQKKSCLKSLSLALSEKSNVEQVQLNENYSHLVYTSAIMRYEDDVEFYIDPKRKGIQLRSASRTGYSDMGVNRERAESIRSTAVKLCR